MAGLSCVTLGSKWGNIFIEAGKNYFLTSADWAHKENTARLPYFDCITLKRVT